MRKNPGRFAGLLYLMASIPGVFALIYVPSKIMVHGDAVATAQNIVVHDGLFRLGIVAELFGQALFIFVALALYDLLKRVNSRRALQMLSLILIAIPIAFVNELNSIAALLLVGRPVVLLVGQVEFLSVFNQPQREALAMLFLRLHGYGFDVAGILWGLWLFPLGLLVYRSGFIARALGVLLILNSFTYPVNSAMSLMASPYRSIVSRWITPLQFGELIFMFWLLIMGARPESESV
jgi:hypothetical protein